MVNDYSAKSTTLNTNKKQMHCLRLVDKLLKMLLIA